MAAITVAVLTLFTLCIVRNPEIKMHNNQQQSEIQDENTQELRGIQHQTSQNSINAPYEEISTRRNNNINSSFDDGNDNEFIAEQ